uniref:nardilysin-like isoform X2 n=1 Tax=Fragaria vesca subsp. vesca TaxID=101020 RepID=UPI0005CB733D|nr:PREDICTED: nardilysin-like isoform X2 [Fragaria vesca subsp. vesca]
MDCVWLMQVGGGYLTDRGVWRRRDWTHFGSSHQFGAVRVPMVGLKRPEFGARPTAELSLDVLEKWILEVYGDVKTGPHVNLEFKAEGPIWKAGKVYRLDADQDVHILQLSWTLPCLGQHYCKGPEFYVHHLLVQEGRENLHFYLKARGWAAYLGASVSRYPVNDVFCMIIYLTDSGSDVTKHAMHSKWTDLMSSFPSHCRDELLRVKIQYHSKL